MELSCKVIQDILPLYAEDLTCAETRVLVEGHIKSCVICNNLLKEQRTQPEGDCQKKMAGLKRVSDGIKKTRLWTVATAVLLMVTIFASALVFLTFPVWATAEETIKKVESLEDGRIKLYFTEQYGGIISCVVHDDRGVLCQKVRWEGLFSTKLPEGMNKASYGHYMIFGNVTVDGEISKYAKDDNIWYINYTSGTAETLLWDSGDVSDGVRMLEMSRILLWVFIGAVASFVLTALVGVLLRNRQSGLVFQNWAAFFGSFCASCLIVTSGRFVVYEEFWMKMSIIGILTVLMSATILCSLHLHRLKKKLEA